MKNILSAQTQEDSKSLLNDYETALANIVDYVYTFDLDGRFTYVNKPLLDLWGLKLEEAVGKNFKDLGYPPHLVKLHGVQLKQVIKTKKPVRGENSYTNYEGKTGYYEYTFVPVFDSQRKIKAIAGTTHDITERKNLAELKLEASKEQYSILFNSIDEGFCIIEVIFNKRNKPVDYRFLEVNSAFERQTGIKDAVGKTVRDLNLDLEKHWFETYGKVALTGRSKRFENYARSMNRSFDVFAARVGGSDSRKVALVFNDITERKRAEEQQKRLAAIVESSDDAIISKSMDGFITTWNKGAEQLYGYKSDEIIGKPVSILMPPEKKDDFPNILKQLKEGKKVEHYETKRKAKDGRILDVSITVSPIRDNTGKIIGASKVARDITEFKQRQNSQRFLERASSVLGTSLDYETTLKSLGELIVPDLADYSRIVVLDEDKQIKEVTVNHVNETMLPLVQKLYESYKNDPKAGVGKLITTGKSELISKISADVLKGANAQTARIVKKLGLKSYMGVPMKIGNKVVGAVTFSSIKKERLYNQEDLFLAEELAHRAALAIENARLYTESQKAVTIRDEFISVASHELKTPVTSLKMYVQVTKMQAHNNGDDTKILDKMDAQINKLTFLIQDLLNVAKFQSGKLEYRDSEFDLHEVVREVIDNLQPTTSKHILQLNGSLKKRVWGDRDRIGQVLTNLVTNAIKYSPGSDKVIIRLAPKKNRASVVVEDFGIGIEKQHLDRLFERFYRVTDTQEKTFPGMGLGLYISNEILKRYGAAMKVTSEKGKGSRFSFSLPYHE